MKPSLQSTDTILMVRPRTFGYDAQTAETNSFQYRVSLTVAEARALAEAEFNGVVRGLKEHEVKVEVFDDMGTGEKPNAVFPNNWLSTWPDGTVYLYPMATESRRSERSSAALDQLNASHNITRLVDISDNELSNRFLESTGVLVFDHINKTVYACLSERCDETLLREHSSALGYEPIVFHAYDQNGDPIYHTNVLMGIQTSTAVICSEAITSEKEREMVLGRLRGTGREVVEISKEQMEKFCGNVLEIKNGQGKLFLAMSQTAYDAFTDEQREVLAGDKSTLPFPIPTIETVGGGSVRCILAEVFLPAR